MENTNTRQDDTQQEPKTTDLERRVLAHERILKSLIAYMSRSEPRFLEHLEKSFVVPMQMSRREQDHTETGDHAEEFVRAVMAEGTALAAREKSGDRLGPLRKASQFTDGILPVDQPRSAARGVEAQERNGVCRVTVDGDFRGDYHTREGAMASAARARLSLD